MGVTFSSLGLPFIVAACVDVALRRERLRRLYVVAVPALLYAVWWVGWGHDRRHRALAPQRGEDAPIHPRRSLRGLRLAVRAGPRARPGGPDWGQPLLLVAPGAWRLAAAPDGSGAAGAVDRARPRRHVLGAGRPQRQAGRGPTASRYQLPGVIFVLMIAAELLRGVRVPRGGIIGAYVVGAAIVAGQRQPAARRLPLLPEHQRPDQGRPRGPARSPGTGSSPRCMLDRGRSPARPTSASYRGVSWPTPTSTARRPTARPRSPPRLSPQGRRRQGAGAGAGGELRARIRGPPPPRGRRRSCSSRRRPTPAPGQLHRARCGLARRHPAPAPRRGDRPCLAAGGRPTRASAASPPHPSRSRTAPLGSRQGRGPRDPNRSSHRALGARDQPAGGSHRLRWRQRPVTCEVARARIELATPRFSVKELEAMIWPWLQGLS